MKTNEKKKQQQQRKRRNFESSFIFKLKIMLNVSYEVVGMYQHTYYGIKVFKQVSTIERVVNIFS